MSDTDGTNGFPGGLEQQTLGSTTDSATDDTQGNAAQASNQIPSDPDELRKGYLRQSDYTRKTMAVADERRALEQMRADLDKERAMLRQGITPQAAAPTAPDVELPDPKADPRGWIEGYIGQQVSQGVKNALESAGLNNLAQDVRPLLDRERLGREYRNFMQEAPELDHNSLSVSAGEMIDGDAGLSELARTNPRLAVRLASQLALARSDADRAKQKNSTRSQAAPVAARAAAPVNGAAPSGIDDAFRNALMQQGITPDF